MLRRLAATLAVLALIALPAAAQPRSSPPGSGFTPEQRREIVEIIRDALRTDPTILRDAIMALQASESAQTAQSAAAAIASHREALLRTPGDPVAGNPNGDVTVVEFYDVRCPYCRRMLPVVDDLIRHDRNLRVVYKDIPILGPASVVAARAVLAAQRQGAYDRMRETLMRGTASIDENVVRTAAQTLGLDWPRLQKDMQDPAIKARLDANIQLAQALDVQGTPAYVVGDQLLPGAVSLSDLQDVVAQARKR
jgi:protein-disulfide isomerase